ncbi:MAG TPA: hypothetical protein VJJ24_02950 [Candidatus Paceibacterota bacterium]
MSPHKIINFILVAVVLLLGANLVYAANFTEPAGSPPGFNTEAPLNVSMTGQVKIGGLTLNTGGAINGLIVALGNIGLGDTTPDSGTGGQLKVDVEGNVGATKYCDQLGNNCYTTTEMIGGGTGGGVSKIIAGTGITVSPTGGTGDVTVSASGGRVIKSGTVTLSSWIRYNDPYAGWYRACSSIGGSFPASYQVLLSSNGVIRNGSAIWRNKTQTSFDVCAVTERVGAYRIFDGTDTNTVVVDYTVIGQ